MANDLLTRYLKGTAFAQKCLSDVRTRDVQHFYVDLQTAGRFPDTIRKLHSFLSTAFNQAVKWEDLARNPCKGVILPKTHPKETQAMTADEAKALIKVCRTREDCVVFELALETGMRPGEYLALSWSDIDLKKRTIRVHRSVAQGFVGGGFEIKEPKTPGSNRTIGISSELVERLVEHRARQQKWIADLKQKSHAPLLLQHMKRKGRNYGLRKARNRNARTALDNIEQYNLVFPGENGLPLSKGNLNRRTFKEVLELAGLDREKFSLYSLRHTAATLSLSAGANLKAVAEKLGHTDVHLLVKTYTHVQSTTRQEAVAKLAGVLY